MNALWRDRSRAERKVVVALGLVIAIGLAAAFVALPLERERSRLQAEVPRLRTSIATLERQADEVRRLRSLPVAAVTRAEPLASLATAGGGRALPGAQITVLDGKTLLVAGSDVGFGALLEWIAVAQSAQGLRVQAARIEALPAAGRVRAELRLARP